MIHFSLRRAQNVHWQATEITRDDHAALKKQEPCVLWFTGLSGSGKSTIANELEKRLNLMNRHTFLLDGDNVRHGLNKDLGFTEADRIENIRRIGGGETNGRSGVNCSFCIYQSVPGRTPDGPRDDARG